LDPEDFAIDPLTLLGPALAAAAVAWLFDLRVTQPGRREPAPPGFATPWRRATAFALLAALFFVALFAPLATPAVEATDLATLHPSRLFLLHGILAAVLIAWAALAYAGAGRRAGPRRPANGPAEPEPGGGPDDPPARSGWTAAPSDVLVPDTGDSDHPYPARSPRAATLPDPAPRPAPQPSATALARTLAAFRLRTDRPGRELAIGLGAGAAAWAAVLAVALAAAWAIAAAGGQGLLPTAPPALVAYLAAQPALLRLGVSVSAGVVEEVFFRGFLQPRLGLLLTTVLFVLAHTGYGQPLQLVGVAVLSVTYGALSRWRGNVWAAASAHALFDAVQLLIVIPAALEMLPEGAPPPSPLG
jgi:membrane protease YdiL (CAAX protease family)